MPYRKASAVNDRPSAGRLLRDVTAVAMVIVPLTATAPAQADPVEPAATPARSSADAFDQVSRPGRTRLNFNANWRFTLGDVAGGQKPAFDDSKWERTGLPHSFSMPYFQARSFYEGYGWYRKHFTLPALPAGRRLSLEFEAAFQDAEIFVNGIKVGAHRGGYTGFPVDITDAVRAGDNVVAVRLNNKWDATLAPRAGEHVFSGGIYRDVWLVATDAVRVDWYGTFVTTPDLSEKSGRVAVATEVRNDSARAVTVTAHTVVKGPNGDVVATLPDQSARVTPDAVGKIAQLSAPIPAPLLWSPQTPVLYRAVTTLSVDGKARDSYETSFGFRTIKWTADKGFFLNGKHYYFKGANVHQDQAGWGDAVTNGAIDRDVKMVKEAGFDFIRGSHYPHDPHFAQATDEQGLMLMSENAFWGVGGHKEGQKWASGAYPVDPKLHAAFDASVKQQLREMIRIFRNHPSVVLWSMDNEVFFSEPETMPDVRRLLKELVAISHEEDPTRPASISGAQRGDIDKLGDVAAYNGDGAKLFLNPGIPNLVSEYGWTITHRPGKYEADFGDLAKTDGLGTLYDRPWHYDWRSGEVLWCAFDHGSIAGRDFGSMSIIDYARLPKRAWYWYRNAYGGIAPPQWPVKGVPYALRVTSSAPLITAADGTDDVQLVVTVVDKDGNALSNSPPVRLSIESGPGELPTGRSISFASDSDIPILDGKAAIAMRSWYSGRTRIRATAPGLVDGVLEVTTTDGPHFVPGVTPVAADRPYHPFDGGDVEKAMESAAVFGTNNPTDASSAADGHSPRLAADGMADTYWAPAAGDTAAWLDVDPEKILLFKKVELTFPKAALYGVTIEARDEKTGAWIPLAKHATGAAISHIMLDTAEVKGRRVRIRLTAPAGRTVGISEVRITGIPQG